MNILAESGDKEIVLSGIPHGKRSICLPVDSSTHSEATLDWVLSKLLKEDDHVILLHVRSDNLIDFSKQSKEKHRKDAVSLLVKYGYVKLIVGNILKQKNFNVTAISLHGDPRLELCRECDLLKPDIIVVGTKGTGGSDNNLGSVAQYLGQNSKWPVLIAHPYPHLPLLSE
jgi:nucleotide-binding universal stress UspA family protein